MLTSVLDPVLAYFVALLRRLLVVGGVGALIVSRFTGSAADTTFGVVSLIVAAVLFVGFRRR